jgi:RIO kinase 2
MCKNKEGQFLILKLARLGRQSFRCVKDKRDYIGQKTQFNWLYLSRIASTKEFIFMKKLYENGFPTPVPIDANRHAILMSYLEGYTFQRITDLEDSVVEKSYHFLLDQIIRLAENGLIHSDFNEYNIVIDDKEPYNVSFIDFPQMVSTDHKEAEIFFYRDINCIERLFRKKHNFVCERDAQIKFEDIKCVKRLDQEVKASGYWKFAGVKAKEVTAMEAVLERGNEDDEYAEGEIEEQEDGDEEASEDIEGLQRENMMDEPDAGSDKDESEDALEEMGINEDEN